MVSSKVISKIAKYIGAAAVLFTVILAVITYFLLQIVALGAPTEYIIITILSSVWPYLFVAVAAFIVAVLSRGTTEKAVEEEEEEALPLKTIPDA
jgi:hypothetical protein